MIKNNLLYFYHYKKIYLYKQIYFITTSLITSLILLATSLTTSLINL